MKLLKFLYIFLGFIGVILMSCTNPEALSDNASIHFKNIINDFGELRLKEEASIVFEFENNGEELLKISEVKTTCGCAVPNWTKEIIKPIEKGSIKVTYDSKYPGRFNKTVRVYYNGKDSPVELKIKGRVRYPEEKN